MHISLILVAIGLCWLLRLQWARSTSPWQQRWQTALGQFLFPPMLLLLTALSVLGMGTQGTMLGLPVGWIGYSIAVAFLGVALLSGLVLFWQGRRSRQTVRSYPAITLENQAARLLNTSSLFAAQVGFWRSELVVSQGLLQSLEPEQLHAVLTHEQAHAYYRDTFWFFWLGWIRRLTQWLPKTEGLWQELLLLRELRADRWAAQRVDSLLLAESLLQVVRSPIATSDSACAAFGDANLSNRLEERIESLLSEPPELPRRHWSSWSWLILSLLPLLTVPLHH